MADDQDILLMIKDDGLLHVGTRGALADHLMENPAGPAPGIDLFDRAGQQQNVVVQPDDTLVIEPGCTLPDAHDVCVGRDLDNLARPVRARHDPGRPRALSSRRDAHRRRSSASRVPRRAPSPRQGATARARPT